MATALALPWNDDEPCGELYISGYTPREVPMPYNAGTLKVKYRKAATSLPVEETVTLTTLELDLTKGFGEKITLGSPRFRLGSSTYVHTAGAIYRDPSVETGAGSLAGTLDPITGRVRLTSWTGGGSNAVTLDALTTEVGDHHVSNATFRTVLAPIKTLLQVRYMLLDGTVKSKTVGETGVLVDNDCVIGVNYQRGVVRMHFGRWWEDAALTPEQKAEDWYSPLNVVNRAGVPSIWQPQMVFSESIIYNAVATVMLPPDSNLLGLDAARLPPTGEALIFRRGMLVLVHHTDSLAKASLTAGEEIDCGRTRLYRVVIEDADGVRLPPDLYTVNRELGTLTMADPLDVSEYTAPFAVLHTIADLQRVSATDISGRLNLLRPVSHDYPADESYVSGLLFAGTLQARVANVFEQTTWTGVWSDALIGAAPLASFNDAAFPIVVTNAWAYPDRILVKFKSATTFDVIGENLGLIGIGDINADCEPINPLTGQPYFTIDYRGWGGGWATGNCLRFNVHGACYPVDVVRAVQPSEPTGLSDCVELLLVGNVDS